MKTIEMFPMLNVAVNASKSPWQKKSLTVVLKAINEYTDSIPNPVFKDAKAALNTVVDVVSDFSGLYSDSFRAAYNFPAAFDWKFDLGFMSSAHAAGKLKLAKKKGFNDQTWVATLNEIVVLHEALEALKDKIVKRAVRSEEERADDYVPPMPTTAVALKITAILKEMTDGLTAEYATILHNDYVTSVENFKPMTREEKMADRRRSGPSFTESILMPLVGETWDSYNGNYTTLKLNWKAILLQRAEADADFAQRMFLYKNVEKLAVIMENKGEFTYKIQHGTVNCQGFQGEIVFTFADGSHFMVRNKVIINTSVHDRSFYQYPTTFHNVTLSDNRPAGMAKMMPGQPSHEDMIEVFSKIGKN